MLLLYPKDGELSVLLNKRTQSVEDHKGEIAFPGGRKDEGDDTLLETARREAHEEMGILPQDVQVLGELGEVATGTNYIVSAFVGTIPEDYQFKPNGHEVAEVIEMPLSVLSDSSKARDEMWIVDGRLVNSPSYSYQDHLIYGATAKFLSRLFELLDSY